MKYHGIISQPGNDLEWITQSVANELAEANRLKRIELELKQILAIDPAQLATYKPNLKDGAI